MGFQWQDLDLKTQEKLLAHMSPEDKEVFEPLMNKPYEAETIEQWKERLRRIDDELEEMANTITEANRKGERYW